jgi:hypothetical protein
MSSRKLDFDGPAYLYLGYGTIFVLGVYAIWFYLERACYLDSAFVIVHLLINDNFSTDMGRYSTALTQVPPLLAAKFELSLKAILISYSLSFIGWLAIIYLLIAHWLKQKALALALLLAFLIMLSEGFFWISNQIQQAIWWIVLLYAVLFRFAPSDESRAPGKITTAAVCLLVLLTIFTHPLAIIPLVFMHGYWLLQGEIRRGHFVWLIPLLAITIWVLKTFSGHFSYEANRINSLRNFIDLFPNYFTIYSNRIFLRLCRDDFFLAIGMLMANIVFYLSRRKWLKLTWLLIFFGGYLLLINVSLASGVARFYLELQYQPLALMIAVPFVLESLPALAPRRIAMMVIAVVLITRLGMIAWHHQPYTARVNWHQSMIRSLAGRDGNRFLIDERDAPMGKLILSWASGFESLIISSLINSGPVKTYLIDEDINRFDRESDHLYQTEWETWPASALPAKYFQLAPSRYQILRKEEIPL